MIIVIVNLFVFLILTYKRFELFMLYFMLRYYIIAAIEDGHRAIKLFRRNMIAFYKSFLNIICISLKTSS